MTTTELCAILRFEADLADTAEETETTIWASYVDAQDYPQHGPGAVLVTARVMRAGWPGHFCGVADRDDDGQITWASARWDWLDRAEARNGGWY